jgi:hypothetical protein
MSALVIAILLTLVIVTFPHLVVAYSELEIPGYPKGE